MKKISKKILHLGTLIGATVVASINVPLLITMIPVLTVSIAKVVDDVTGNEIDNSIFSVTKKGKIVQNSTSKPFRFFKLLKSKDKNEAFTNEAINMFTQLKQKDDKGNIINYSTVSHAKTIHLLKGLKSNGYIDNLEYEKKYKSKLILEKLLFGNTKKLFKSKKTQMYDISFNLTDKERKYDDIINLTKPKEVEEKIIELPKENKEANEIQEKIRILNNYKEELEQKKYENSEELNKKRNVL